MAKKGGSWKRAAAGIIIASSLLAAPKTAMAQHEKSSGKKGAPELMVQIKVPPSFENRQQAENVVRGAFAQLRQLYPKAYAQYAINRASRKLPEIPKVKLLPSIYSGKEDGEMVLNGVNVNTGNFTYIKGDIQGAESIVSDFSYMLIEYATRGRIAAGIDPSAVIGVVANYSAASMLPKEESGTLGMPMKGNFALFVVLSEMQKEFGTSGALDALLTASQAQVAGYYERAAGRGAYENDCKNNLGYPAPTMVGLRAGQDEVKRLEKAAAQAASQCGIDLYSEGPAQ